MSNGGEGRLLLFNPVGSTYYEPQQCVCCILAFLKIILALSIYVYLFYYGKNLRSGIFSKGLAKEFN